MPRKKFTDALKAGFSLRGKDVVEVLRGIAAHGRKPAVITVDYGGEVL